MIYKTALITGGAIRIGKDICKKLHENGYNIICHYNKSENEAKDLKSELNKLRKGSCEIFSLDLNDFEQVKELTSKINNNSNSLDLLVNNASSFFKTDVENHNDSDWDDLINSNLRGPFLLSRHCKKMLSESKGLIINISDAMVNRGMKNYVIYSMAKAGLENLTKTLAREFAPEVRVNAVAPGAILLPSDGSSEEQDLLNEIPSKFKGEYSGTKNVSERHTIDQNKLQEFLNDKLENFGDIKSIEEFVGGQSNPTYLLKTQRESYVLRRKPPGKLLKSAHAVDREYKVIAALNKTDVPVPKAYIHCEDESVIGTEFFLMSFVDGEVMWEPHIPQASNEERQKIYHSMNETIAMLHSVDHESIGLETFGKPGNYVGRQVARWSKQYVASETREIKSMNNLMEWLPKNLPAEKATKLVHGDFSLSNVMIDLKTFKICAILDWELSTLGDPAADFSYHCIQYKLNPVLSDEKQCKDLCIPTEMEYLEMYEEKTGYQIKPEWNLYMGFNLFKLAAISQGIMGRVRDGTAAGKNADSFGENAVMMADEAWKLINE